MSGVGTPVHWGVFFGLLAVVLAFDLGVLNRGARVVTARRALGSTLFFVSLAAGFAVWLAFEAGSQPTLEFVTGYLIEYALSVDNLFVFLVIFSYFAVPKQHQHRVLFWGIVGALVLRGVFILAGTALIERFHWMLYLFGLFLVVTGGKLLFAAEEEMDLEQNVALKLCRRFLPVTSQYHGERFVVRLDGKTWATPLLLVLLVVDIVDVIFAVDSIPAVFGVTRDPFLVFTSNMFAILGLRSLYFLLAHLMGRFHYLKYGLGVVLAFVGAKMLVADVLEIPIVVALGAIVLALGVAVAASWLFPPRAAKTDDDEP
ncbi:MAG: TerC family protein [Thermoanaerobaculia bacterium]